MSVTRTKKPIPASRSQQEEKPQTALLSTEGLIKVYDGRAVVRGVDINVKPGEIVGLLGPNGAGKTTTFYMIVGLVPPDGGKVLFRGHEVTRQPMYKRARLGMGYLPQEESIFRKLSVEDNIMAVLETQPLSRKARKERCQELLEQFGITKLAEESGTDVERRRETSPHHCPFTGHESHVAHAR